MPTTIHSRCIARVYDRAAQSAKERGLTLGDYLPHEWAAMNDYADQMYARYIRLYSRARLIERAGHVIVIRPLAAVAADLQPA